MKMNKLAVYLVTGLLFIFSGSGNAYAPVSANLHHDGNVQAENSNHHLIIDGNKIDLIKLLNSEVSLFDSEGTFSESSTEVNLKEKRVTVKLNNAVVSFQFMNAALSKAASSFSLRYSETAKAALVITAPRVEAVNDFQAEIISLGQGNRRLCWILDLKKQNGKTAVVNMRKVSFPGKTASYTYLINDDNTFGKNQVPDDLVSIPRDVGAYQSKPDMKLNAEAAENLKKMLEQARKEGISQFTLTSTYRPYSYQSKLFDKKVNQLGSETRAATIVARPGTSEHQSGLAIDFSTNGTGLTESFAMTPQGQWLENNSWKFGYILRYQKDKTGITKIVYEPWHFRYVGYPYSKILYDRKICLEEFINNIQLYGYYAVDSGRGTFLTVFNPGNQKIYLSEAVPKTPEI